MTYSKCYAIIYIKIIPNKDKRTTVYDITVENDTWIIRRKVKIMKIANNITVTDADCYEYEISIEELKKSNINKTTVTDADCYEYETEIS